MTLSIYTDGSCEPNPGFGGWAFVAYDGRHEVAVRSGCEAGTTNNRMELTAILEAIQWLDGRPGCVLSDSQYAVNGIVTWSRGWKRAGWKRKEKGRLVDVANADLWMAIEAARRAGQCFEWVRGHAGHAGNERADELAEMARHAGRSEQRDLSLMRR